MGKRAFNTGKVVCRLGNTHVTRSLGELQSKSSDKRDMLHHKLLKLEYMYYAVSDGSLVGFNDDRQRDRFLKRNGGVKIGNKVARVIYEEYGLATRSLDEGVE